MVPGKSVVIPDFPENFKGLVRGSILRSKSELTKQVGIAVGEVIPIGFDGKYIRCGDLTWSVDRLIDEILLDVWEVTGRIVDLSDEERSMRFARVVEHLG